VMEVTEVTDVTEMRRRCDGGDRGDGHDGGAREVTDQRLAKEIQRVRDRRRGPSFLRYSKRTFQWPPREKPMHFPGLGVFKAAQQNFQLRNGCHTSQCKSFLLFYLQ